MPLQLPQMQDELHVYATNKMDSLRILLWH